MKCAKPYTNPSASTGGVISRILAFPKLAGQRILKEWIYEPESAWGESGNDENALDDGMKIKTRVKHKDN